ncbi:GNAT family N-acetyltransferase [Nocardia crassostreae]|uniref:GNAT family N-acetyltransferase n=1 Tax=Nocardia crassostreae TaxID=53428 RepID=UPI00083198E8|nr:GNAT family N-acetyltransferase [Nocardia crassostreae]
MSWTLSEDPAAFDRAAGAYLAADPIRHTIPLSVVGNLAAGRATFDSTLFGWWADETRTVTAAFMHTPPWPAGLYGVDERAAAELVRILTERDHRISAVNTEAATAHLFTDAWTAAHRRNTKAGTMMRLYRLGELTAPVPPPGAARTAELADRDLIAEWFTAFQGETGGPAAVACCLLPCHGVSRIAPVYTPPERRGCGYAGGATTAVVHRARELGAQEVVLFADLANPTSNALYQRLGFRPVTDFTIREMC